MKTIYSSKRKIAQPRLDVPQDRSWDAGLPFADSSEQFPAMEACPDCSNATDPQELDANKSFGGVCNRCKRKNSRQHLSDFV
jgi:hypothetical protein